MLTENHILELGSLALVLGLSPAEAKYLPALTEKVSYHTQGNIDRAMWLLSARQDIQEYCVKVIRECVEKESQKVA